MNGWRMEMFLYMTTPEQESWWCFLESWKLQMQEHTGVEWKYLTILRASLNFSWASDTVRNKKYFLLHVWSICSDFYIFFYWLTDAKFPKMETESAYLGEEVNISCQIPEEHKVHFCKEDDNHICQNISSSKVTQMSGSSERNEERVFTVSISNVSVRDAGVYWCGAETRDTYLTFISLTTKIQLNIISNGTGFAIFTVC